MRDSFTRFRRKKRLGNCPGARGIKKPLVKPGLCFCALRKDHFLFYHVPVKTATVVNERPNSCEYSKNGGRNLHMREHITFRKNVQKDKCELGSALEHRLYFSALPGSQRDSVFHQT